MGRRPFIAVFSVFLLFLVINYLVTIHYFQSGNYAETPLQINVKDLKVWYIGNYAILGELLERIQFFGAQIINLNDASEPISFNSLSLVLFESEWLSKQVGNPEFHVFLRDAVDDGAKLLSHGLQTSSFFQVLDKAGINALVRDDVGTIRNPAYNNPPFVGFQLEQSITPIGPLHFYPSFFFCNSANVDLQIQELVNWIKE